MGRRVLTDFYVPALSESVSYDRIAGFFSSSALAVAARGITGLIANQGHMRLIVSPRLSAEDSAALLALESDSDPRLSELLLRRLDFDAIEEVLQRDHVRALCWLLKTGLLEMRVAIARDGEAAGLFHQKIGVLRDDSGDAVTFSGSVNETARGWLDNLEHFKVFRSWEPVESAYVQDDVGLFEDYWRDGVPGARVFTLPEAVAQKLISQAPPSPDELDLEVPTTGENVAGCPVDLWPHQRAAVVSWWEARNRRLFQMATGTGKTVTALECARQYVDSRAGVLVVITVPMKHLAAQWMKDVVKFFPGVPALVVPHGSAHWRARLLEMTSRVAAGTRRAAVVVAVQNSAATSDFLECTEAVGRSPNSSVMFIGDEAHGLGARRMRSALSPLYQARLGLSATPYRWFDDEGSQVLEDYFGSEPYSFLIADALRTFIPGTSDTILVPYHYQPRFVSLESEELEDYAALTRKAARSRAHHAQDDSANSQEETYLFRRAGVVKCAGQKLLALERILDELGRDVRHLIIYCFDRTQMRRVEEVLARRRLVFSEFTGAEGTGAESRFDGLSEREFLLRQFGAGDVPILVAMKCLDAGVDVPSARIGVILASSTNPTEFIQRRGRLLRRAKGKRNALIYDVLVRPGLSRSMDTGTREMELAVFRKELERLDEFASTADNRAECAALVMKEMNNLLHGMGDARHE